MLPVKGAPWTLSEATLLAEVLQAPSQKAQRNTPGSLSWGGGQPRVAGDLVLALAGFTRRQHGSGQLGDQRPEWFPFSQNPDSQEAQRTSATLEHK